MLIEVKEHKYTPNGGHEYGDTLLKIEKRDVAHVCDGTETDPRLVCPACSYEFRLWGAVMEFQAAVGNNVAFVDGMPQVIESGWEAAR